MELARERTETFHHVIFF